MAKLKYIIIHCSDTPPHMNVTKELIEQWHMMPLIKANGEAVYKGKTYKDKMSLPDERINGLSIKSMTGRGWDRVGYQWLIKRSGTIDILKKVDNDNVVERDERTWGVAGMNDCSFHICLAGGQDEFRKQSFGFKKTFTLEQELTLYHHLQDCIELWGDVQIAGHNDFATKSCPNFNVKEWLLENHLQTKNIYNDEI
jgi:hypothetical protein